MNLIGLDSIKHAPINDQVYRSNRHGIEELAASIRMHGIITPLTISEDGYIISGHRRHAAAQLAGLESVPVEIDPITWRDDRDLFITRLVHANRQRVKGIDDHLRESLILAGGGDFADRVRQHREEAVGIPVGVMVEGGAARKRNRVSSAKLEMVHAVLRIMEALKDERLLPCSNRQLHYRLLNEKPLIHTKKQARYENTRACYSDLCDLLTRLRINETYPIISFETITDDTRPVTRWRVWADSSEFVDEQVSELFTGYSRDLMRSQCRHFEILAEKMTVETIVKRVASKYTIPVTIGRGYSGSPCRYQLAKRFLASGKDALTVFLLGDLDAEGVNIGDSLLDSMKRDFGLTRIDIIRAAVNPEQIQKAGLVSFFNPAKESSRKKGFVDKFGNRTYELEALPPALLAEELDKCIRSNIDLDRFNVELDEEGSDIDLLAAHRERIIKALFAANGTEEG